MAIKPPKSKKKNLSPHEKRPLIKELLRKTHQKESDFRTDEENEHVEHGADRQDHVSVEKDSTQPQVRIAEES